jgi:hypothetical protein
VITFRYATFLRSRFLMLACTFGITGCLAEADLKSGPGGGVFQPLQLGVNPANVDFVVPAGGPNPGSQSVAIVNTGPGTVNGLGVATILYEPVVGGWLTASIGGATSAPATLQLSVDVTGIAPGLYFAIVPVVSSVTGVLQRDVVVSLTVTPVPVINVSPDTVFLTGTAGGANPAPQPISVTNSGTGSLSGMSAGAIRYDSTASGWLSATLDQPIDPAILTLQASIGSLAAGTHTAFVPVISSVPGILEDSVAVMLTISSTSVLPAIGLSPTSISVTAEVLGPNPPGQLVSVSNTGGGTLSGLNVGTIVYSPIGVNWLTATLNQTTAPATLTLSASIASLQAGTYRAQVRIQAPGTSNSPRAVNVTLVVTAAPGLVLSTQNVAFAGTIGQSDPLPKNIAVTNAGTGTLLGISSVVTYGAGQPTGWLQTSQSGSTTPLALLLFPHISGVPAGNYTATVDVSTTSPGISSKTISVALALASQTGFFNIISGDGQTGLVDSVLPNQLVARVTDVNFNPVANVPVVWSVQNGGTLFNTTSVTDNIGEVRTSWRLGHFAGIHTVSVSSAGLPTQVFTADAQLPPSGGAAHPNEPAGFVRFAEHNMSSLPSYPKTLGGLAGSWFGFPQNDPDLVIVNPDTSAPASPPLTIRTRFPAGLPGGNAPVDMGGWDAAGSGATGQKSKVYTSMWIKLLGNDYENHPVITKMGFIAYALSPSAAQNQGVWQLKGTGQQTIGRAFAVQFGQQGPLTRVISQNASGGNVMTVGVWHHWETLMELNTLGEADGVLKWWVDGVLVMDYSDIEYIVPGSTNHFHGWKWNPTWGGTCCVRTRDDYFAIDHVYISGVP